MCYNAYMNAKKYLKDYRVEESVDERGRVIKEAVYIGGDYVFTPPVPTIDKRIIMCLSVLSCLAFVGALIPLTRAMQLVHVILPFTLSMISMYLMVGAAGSLLFVKEVMTHERAETISKRLPPTSLITAGLTAVAFVGFIVDLIASAGVTEAGDFIYAVLVFVVSFSSAVIYYKCRKMKVIKLDPEGDNNSQGG